MSKRFESQEEYDEFMADLYEPEPDLPHLTEDEAELYDGDCVIWIDRSDEPIHGPF